MWIWALIVQNDFNNRNPGKLDWLSPGFGRAFGLYLMLNTCGNCVQNYLYFLIGTIGEGTTELSRLAGLLRGIESWGQCAAFGINSSKFSPLYTVVINVVFWFLSLGPAIYNILQIQGRPEYAGQGAEQKEMDTSAPGTPDEKERQEPIV